MAASVDNINASSVKTLANAELLPTLDYLEVAL